MSKKAAERGSKRTCPSCEVRFYDLNRDPITCPMCQEQFAAAAFATRAEVEAAAVVAAEKASRKAAAKKAAFDEAEAAVPSDADLPEVADVPDVEGEAVAEGEEETFLPEEEEDTDVSGFIDGGIEEPGEEET